METIDRHFKWPEATGKAKFIADRRFDNVLHARLYHSDCPRGAIVGATLPKMPNGYYLFGAEDVKQGENFIPNVTNDLPAFADKEVRFVGQIVYLLVGPDPSVLADLLSQIKVEYDTKPPVFNLEDAKAQLGGPILEKDNVFDQHQIFKGDIDKGFASAVKVIEETVSTGYQEHVYIEPQGVVGYWKDGKVCIEGSMQCPYYVHHAVSTILGHNDVRVIQATTGGGFGGKEDQPDIIAAPVALAVQKLKQPVRLILDREEDIAFTSKRHPLTYHYRTGIDADGRIVAMDIDIEVNGGAYFTLSGIVLQRAMTTATNVYDFPNVRVNGKAYALNTVPNGAFRGFGSPQNCFCMETHMAHIAAQLDRDPLEFKTEHLLNNDSHSLTGAKMHQPLVLNQMLERICEMSNYHNKNRSLASAEDQHTAHGIGLALVQHGCGFAGDLEDLLVKAKVTLSKDAQDQVYIHASNTDIGQGVSYTFRQIVAQTLSLPMEQVHCCVADTDNVPNSGPTVASRSIVICGYLLEKAAERMRDNWRAGEADSIDEIYVKPEYHQWDQVNFVGNAYQATSYGVNAVEVAVNKATAEITITGAWAVYDIGKAINPQIFRGQIDGGLVQALGYGYCEKLELAEDGSYKQKTMADYVIPTTLDVPTIGSDLVDNPYEFGPLGAKGGGELTHNGGAAALVAAVEHAIGKPIQSIPVTPEHLMEVMDEY